MSRRERQRYRRRRRTHPFRKVFGMTALVSVCCLALGALFGVGWVVAVADSAPNLSELKPHKAHPLTEFFTADGTPLGYVHSSTFYTKVAAHRIPRLMRQATV